MKYLIVGLGNIGDEYRDTRHNIGFKVLDAFARASNTVFSTERYGDVARMRLKNKQLILLKPSTYMNLSGSAVKYWKDKEGIELDNILVIVDDLALPFGAIRIKGRGSDAGHNGLKHIANRCVSAFAFWYWQRFSKRSPGGLCAWLVYVGPASKSPYTHRHCCRCYKGILSCRHKQCYEHI